MKCPECGKTVERAEYPTGAIVYIGTLMTTLGKRVRRYEQGREMPPVVIITKSQPGYPVHQC